MTHNKRITEIIDKTAQGFGLSVTVMMSRCKIPEVALPRMSAMFFAREEGFTLTGIARRFNRHHHAVWYAFRAIQNEIETNKTFAQKIEEIRKQLKES